MKPYFKKTIGVVGLMLSVIASVSAQDYTVGQRDKAFTVDNLKIKVGDTVHFLNEDPFFHNVFSLSSASTFDLGSYPEGEDRTVTFDKAGTVEVECAIHADMYLVIEVE